MSDTLDLSKLWTQLILNQKLLKLHATPAGEAIGPNRDTLRKVLDYKLDDLKGSQVLFELTVGVMPLTRAAFPDRPDLYRARTYFELLEIMGNPHIIFNASNRNPDLLHGIIIRAVASEPQKIFPDLGLSKAEAEQKLTDAWQAAHIRRAEIAYENVKLGTLAKANLAIMQESLTAIGANPKALPFEIDAEILRQLVLPSAGGGYAHGSGVPTMALN